jgi:hypothetical protein
LGIVMTLSAMIMLPGAESAASAATNSTQVVHGQQAISSKTVWLCRPGQLPDPCAGNLTATSVSASGSTTAVPNAVASSSKFDCFYVYPSVSRQLTPNANLKVQAGEIGAAVSQAAQFSQVCNVWAPMYRQRTTIDLAKGLGADPTADAVAYASLLSGWKTFLAHDSDGRPIIFIGHSQGAAMLIRLLHNVIDPNPKLRKLVVSAIIAGGNVQVPTGKTVGGSFKKIPLCASVNQTGCVIAYSSFGSTPPANTIFGRPGQGVSLQSQQTAKAGQQVACVNPSTFGAGVGNLTPYFPTVTATVPGVNVSTPWVTFPGLYTAQCKSSGGVTWLQVTTKTSPGDPRPTVMAAQGPTWGYHADDINLSLGNLVHDVSLEEAAYH